jgi:hypothetical protein
MSPELREAYQAVLLDLETQRDLLVHIIVALRLVLGTSPE